MAATSLSAFSAEFMRADIGIGPRAFTLALVQIFKPTISSYPSVSGGGASVWTRRQAGEPGLTTDMVASRMFWERGGNLFRLRCIDTYR
jgi:hypothetical protein